MSRPEPRPEIRALEGYHSPQLEVDVRLNTNESPYAPPADFVAEWTAALAAVPLHRYPDRAATDLRTAIGKRVGHPAERIFAANGSNEVLQTILLTYGGPGRRALVLEPTYALHSHIARITGTTVLAAERRADFTVDPDAVAAIVAAEQPEVVFLCSPNNPTGTVDEPAVLDAVLAVAEGLVVVDEAYGEFAPRSALARVDDDAALVVVRTYSKVWSMAALRLGYCVAPTWVVEELEKVVLPYHLAAATQLAGTVALEYAAEMEERVASLVRERERVVAALGALPGLTVFPSGANFVLFRVDGPDPAAAARAVWQALVDRGVLIRDFSSWPLVEGCLRVTIGAAEEDERFLTALGEVLREHGAR